MTTPRVGTWLRVLLVASLALNVAFAAGFAWRHFDGHDGRPGMHRTHAMRGTMMPSPRVLRQVLPEERRVVVDALLEEHRTNGKRGEREAQSPAGVIGQRECQDAGSQR